MRRRSRSTKATMASTVELVAPHVFGPHYESLRSAARFHRRARSALLRHRLPAHLATRRAQDLREQVTRAGDLMPRQVCRSPIVELEHSRGTRLGENHGDADVPAEDWLADRKGADVRRVRESLDHRVDIRRIDLHATFVDLLSLSAAEKSQPRSSKMPMSPVTDPGALTDPGAMRRPEPGHVWINTPARS